MHTHEIAQFGGLANRMPRYAFFFMAFTMAGMGPPATSGFVGEFLVLVGTLHVNFWLALFGAMGGWASIRRVSAASGPRRRRR